jgi:hypothetical protein
VIRTAFRIPTRIPINTRRRWLGYNVVAWLSERRLSALQ